MKTLEYRTVNKENWGAGPWQDEPDKMQFTDQDTKMPCLIVRGPHGALCGYVGVDRNHPFFEKNYTELKIRMRVHGDLTFADFCQDTDDECHGICHKVENDEDDRVWWLGFDCSHYYDFSPGCSSLNWGKESYRTIDYVKGEIKELAKQLFALKGNDDQAAG